MENGQAEKKQNGKFENESFHDKDMMNKTPRGSVHTNSAFEEIHRS